MAIYSEYDGTYLGHASNKEEENKLRQEDLERIRDIRESMRNR